MSDLGKAICVAIVVVSCFYLAGIYAERHAPTYDTTPAVDHCPKEAP